MKRRIQWGVALVVVGTAAAALAVPPMNKFKQSTKISADDVNQNFENLAQSTTALEQKLRLRYHGNAGSLAVPSGAQPSPLAFPAMDFEIGNGAAGSVSNVGGWVFTAPRAGVYSFTVGVPGCGATSPTAMGLELRVNASPNAESQGLSGAAGGGSSLTTMIKVAAGDEVSAHLWHLCGAPAKFDGIGSFVTVAEL